ncbi:MAG: branched-chain amino acid transaminase [Gammaproteobacteria bacterium]|jgi:branched-chain amino acid aminotransferase|nr:branched-chain amino acid transaminase [Gammaproteobacteria bacterium]
MTMEDRDGFIWMDGEWLDWREAKVHVLTHTLHYGMGAFEGVRAYETENGPAIFKLEEHTERLFNSTRILGMKIPYDAKTLNQAQKEVVTRNNLKSAYIRPMCFYGSEGMGLRADNLKVHTMIAAWEWGAYLGEDNIKNGIRIRTSSYVRHPAHPSLSGAKTNGIYVNSMMALKEALDHGFDEALMLDIDGNVSEGSGENIFVIKDNVIYTPHLTSALPGITRDTIFTLSKSLGYEIIEKKLSCDEIYASDEAFFTGTAAEVTPIRDLDGNQIGQGTRGPVTEKLQSLYFDCVHGRNSDFIHWIDSGRCL